ncbi:MAG: type II toxin-antitoxin system Phd/YefM family antitoxin [Proteobacteria bacterium]|nr:type II toxin-antitoxin system Phd/YefM family antitoxin [Pseudomonadota bacterium]
MKAGTEKKEPQIVFRGGKPSAVILDIDVYQEILERLEDIEDLQILARMREKSLSFRKLDSFLKEYPRDRY